MKVSYVEGVANHNGFESCVGVRKSGGEALTGEGKGRVLSREIHDLSGQRRELGDADALGIGGRQEWAHRFRKARPNPVRSETPSMYGNTLCGNREIPRLSAEERTAGRIGKSEDVRR